MQTFTTVEARTQQQAQKSTSTFSALLVAGILHAIIVAGLAIWYLAGPEPREPELIISAPVGESIERVQSKDFSTVTKEAPAASSSQMARVITAQAAVSNVAVPSAPDITLDTMDLGVGFGDGFGMGMGGDGFGSGGGPPKGSPLSDRCSAKDRGKRLADGGGSAETEAAVIKALAWLKTKQNEDGSWGGGHKVAMTGLALLSYLGHCETYDSREYGETVRKAINYLAEKALNDNGILRTQGGHSWVYEHGIGTYALCEAYSMLRYGKHKFPHMEPLKEAIGLAVPIIIEGQNHDGGWVYEYEGSEWYQRTTGESGEKSHGDTSVAGWHMQALKGATLTGMEFKGIKRSIRDGVEYLQNVQGPQGGFGYRGQGDKYSLAGVGALAQQMFRQGSAKSIRKAVAFILKTEVKIPADDASIYGWYYGAQACFQRGGSDWKKWNTMFRDQAVTHQSEDGSWPSEGGTGGESSSAAGGAADIYRTCLFTLILEVYYRYLPATE
jgi:hypothetical protein